MTLATRMMSLDAGGALALFRAAQDDASAVFHRDGAVHITNTGLDTVEKLLPLLPTFGFGEAEQFAMGGRTSASWQTKWVAPGLRRLDFYPAHLHLLPSGEVQYQHLIPQRILFYCLRPADDGGQMSIHFAKDLQEQLAQTAAGQELMTKLARHGQTIEVGFLDDANPAKPHNYSQSWQERFGTSNRDAALALAKSHVDEYDECWWREDDPTTLMTRVTLPIFISPSASTSTSPMFMRFPRIALDGPRVSNGYRRYPLGNGDELAEAEVRLLRNVYSLTKQSILLRQGDVVLMDNIKCAHSRDLFTGSRDVLLAMAGSVRI